jgi:hypothetical protein
MQPFKLSFTTILILTLVLIGGSATLASIYLGGQGSVQLEKGLVGHWKFDGNAKDSTPNENNGTVTGASLTTDRKGQSNKAYSFNGTSDKIDIGSESAIDGVFSGGGSVVAWINPSSDGEGNFGRIIDKASGDSAGYRIFVSGESGGFVKLRFLVFFDGVSNGEWVTSSAVVPLTTATHIAVVYNSDSVSNNPVFYVNGTALTVGAGLTEDNTPNGTFVSDSGSDLTIGNTADTSRTFDGSIDDVRAYNRALSAAEITALYDSYNPSVAVSTAQKGLVGHWKFDGNAKDSTPYENNGTVTGASLTTDRKGQSNKAYSFDGSDDITVSHNATTQLLTSGFTIAVWVNPDSSMSDSNHRIVDKSTGTNGDNGYFIAYSASADWVSLNINAGTARTSPSGSVTPEQWTHAVASVASNGTVTWYINGSQSGTPGISRALSGITTTNNLTIGKRSNASDRFFTGEMSDFRIYNRAISAAEVLELYDSYSPSIQVSSIQKGLVGYWNFSGNAKDQTPNGNNGTVTGADPTATDRKGQASKAYSFNGSSHYISITDSDALDFGTGDFTISAWVNPTTLSGRITNKRDETGAQDQGATFSINSSGFASLATEEQGAGSTAVNGTIAVNDGNWHHVVGVRSGTTLSAYVDGAFDNSATGTVRNVSTSTSLLIGAGAKGSTPTDTYFGGGIDDLRMYDRALSAAEVLELYETYQ